MGSRAAGVQIPRGAVFTVFRILGQMSSICYLKSQKPQNVDAVAASHITDVETEAERS